MSISFAEAMRQINNQAFQRAQRTLGGGSNFIKLVKGVKQIRLLLDMENVLAYLAFRSHGGKSEDGKYQQAVDLNWLRRQPEILSKMVEMGKLTEDQAAEIVALGDPATNLFFLLRNGLGLDWQEIRKIGRDNPGGSPRAYWNVWSDEDGGLGLLETAAGDKGNLKSWFDTTATSKGMETILGHNGYVEVTGTGEGLSRSYNFAFVEAPFDFPDDLKPYDLIELLSSKVLLPYDKLEFVKRSYGAHLLEAKVGVPESLLNGQDSGE